jgi:multidrug efflux pump subunit AcrB
MLLGIVKKNAIPMIDFAITKMSKEKAMHNNDSLFSDLG